MSITAAGQVPQQKLYGIAQQAAWGTAIADNVAFTQLDVEHTEVKKDPKVEENPQSTGARVMRDASRIVHTNELMPTISLSGLVFPSNIDLFLAAIFQNVSEGATTPFAKTFTFPDTIPAFAADAGYFFTIIEQDPAASKSTKLVDAICSKLSLTGEAGGFLKYSAEFVGRGLPSDVANPSGTWTRGDESEILAVASIDRMTINPGSSASYHLKSFELTKEQAVIPIGQDGSGNHASVSLGQPQLSLSMTLVKDADWHALLTAKDAGTIGVVNIGWGNATPGTVDNDFDITARLQIQSAEKDHSEVMYGKIGGQLLEADDGATEPLTIVMANAVDRAW
jgi:hypothetical protein